MSAIRRAFTLVEVVATVAILAIVIIPVSLLVLSYMQAVIKADAQSRAQDIACREMAVIANLPYTDASLANNANILTANYANSGLDLRRQVIGDNTQPKEITLTLYTSGSATPILSLVTYKGSKTFGSGSGLTSPPVSTFTDHFLGDALSPEWTANFNIIWSHYELPPPTGTYTVENSYLYSYVDADRYSNAASYDFTLNRDLSGDYDVYVKLFDYSPGWGPTKFVSSYIVKITFSDGRFFWIERRTHFQVGVTYTNQVVAYGSRPGGGSVVYGSADNSTIAGLIKIMVRDGRLRMYYDKWTHEYPITDYDTTGKTATITISHYVYENKFSAKTESVTILTY